MELGVYYAVPNDLPLMRSLGVVYSVRPTLQRVPFKSEKFIYRLDDPTYKEAYGADEVDDPIYGKQRLRDAPPGSFVDISNGGWGRNAGIVGSGFHRGVLNYTGEIIPDVFSVPRGFVTFHNCLRHWGTDWTPCVWGAAPAWWLRFQLRRYARAGLKRAFLYCWNDPRGRRSITATLTGWCP